MPTALIKNGNIILKDTIVKGASVLIEGGKIKNVGSSRPLPGITTIDAKGCFVTSGFIDSHIHGDPADILAHEVRYGTTAIVVALSCAAADTIDRQVKEIYAFKENNPLGPAVLGLRLEGPFINKENSGAQDKRFIKPPSTAGLRRMIKKCGPLLKIVTLAPELEGASELIRILRKNKIIASVGHSNADYRQAAQGVDAGIVHATHLFNGMSRITASDAGVSGACLVDKRVAVEIIFDLVHVRPALLHLALVMKKSQSIILITDSVRAETHSRKTRGGVYRLKDGTVAGSDLTMIEAIKNAVTSCGVTLTDAVRFATINPARFLGLDALKAEIAPGKDADVVIFDKDFDVKMTMVRGKIVYRKGLRVKG